MKKIIISLALVIVFGAISTPVFSADPNYANCTVKEIATGSHSYAPSICGAGTSGITLGDRKFIIVANCNNSNVCFTPESSNNIDNTKLMYATALSAMLSNKKINIQTSNTQPTSGNYYEAVRISIFND